MLSCSWSADTRKWGAQSTFPIFFWVYSLPISLPKFDQLSSQLKSLKTLKVRGLELKSSINLALIAMDEVCSCERHNVAKFRNELHCHHKHRVEIACASNSNFHNYDTKCLSIIHDHIHTRTNVAPLSARILQARPKLQRNSNGFEIPLMQWLCSSTTKYPVELVPLFEACHTSFVSFPRRFVSKQQGRKWQRQQCTLCHAPPLFVTLLLHVALRVTKTLAYGRRLKILRGDCDFPSELYNGFSSSREFTNLEPLPHKI